MSDTSSDSRVPWHEDDDFWRAAAPTLFDDRAWQAAATDAPRLAGLLGVSPPAAVLDLGCGPGRYSIPLAGMGFEVTGVDRTVSYLQEAARRATDGGVSVELVHADMRDFERPEAFDAAVSMLTSFGYFDDPEEDRRVLRHVHASLRPGGAFLVDTIGKEILARIFLPREWRECDGETWLHERRIVDAWSWIENRWIRFRDGTRVEFRLGHRLFSARELIDLLGECGFVDSMAYGSLDGEAYDEKASRLVVLGRKGG